MEDFAGSESDSEPQAYWRDWPSFGRRPAEDLPLEAPAPQPDTKRVDLPVLPTRQLLAGRRMPSARRYGWGCRAPTRRGRDTLVGG